jgi:hypothetical protein
MKYGLKLRHVAAYCSRYIMYAMAGQPRNYIFIYGWAKKYFGSPK